MSTRTKFLEQITSIQEKLNLRRSEIQQAEKRYKRSLERYEKAVSAMQLIDLIRFFRVAIFGSARLKAENSSNRFIAQLTQALVESRKIDIVTGGGPGIMEAANEGLKNAHTHAIQNGQNLNSKNHGVLIELPFEENANQHLHISFKHQNFGTRLHELIHKTHGAYCAPGGLGTNLELIFLLQLQQAEHLERSYPVLAHPEWEPIIEKTHDVLYHQRVAQNEAPTINEEDLKKIIFTRDIEEIVSIFSAVYDQWRKQIKDKIIIVDDLPSSSCS